MKINKCLLISLILGILYSCYLVWYLGYTALHPPVKAATHIGVAIAILMIAPHMIMSILATIFNAVGTLLHKPGFALTGAIFYTIALVVFPFYFYFVIIQMILSYIGFAMLRKQRSIA